MTLFVAGIVIAAAAALTASWFLVSMYRYHRIRIAHGVPNPVFFRSGSGLVFGTLSVLILLGLALAYLSR